MAAAGLQCLAAAVGDAGKVDTESLISSLSSIVRVEAAQMLSDGVGSVHVHSPNKQTNKPKKKESRAVCW